MFTTKYVYSKKHKKLIVLGNDKKKQTQDKQDTIPETKRQDKTTRHNKQDADANNDTAQKSCKLVHRRLPV